MTLVGRGPTGETGCFPCDLCSTLPMIGDLVNLASQVGALRTAGFTVRPTRAPFHVVLVQLCSRRPRSSTGCRRLILERTVRSREIVVLLLASQLPPHIFERKEHFDIQTFVAGGEKGVRHPVSAES